MFKKRDFDFPMKKSNLKESVVESAWKIVEAEGVAKLNIRNVAKLSACSIGSIYNVFHDIQELYLYLNAKILKQLYYTLFESVEQAIQEKSSLRSLFKSVRAI